METHFKKKTGKGTATEHATTQSEPYPAASTDDILGGVGNGFVLELRDVEKTLELLMWMARDFHPSFHRDDIADAALEVIIKHVDAAIGGALGSLHTASVAKLSALVDIMMLTKDGSPKVVNATLEFMRWLTTFREEIRATSSDNATERVELDKDEVSLCYRRFGRILLTDDFLPHQKREKRYRL